MQVSKDRQRAKASIMCNMDNFIVPLGKLKVVNKKLYKSV